VQIFGMPSEEMQCVSGSMKKPNFKTQKKKVLFQIGILIFMNWFAFIIDTKF
jgi:hypothetical protein